MTEASTRGPAHPDALPALTGLRFLAALSVLVGHSFADLVKFSGIQPLWAHYLSHMAAIGMPLFFVLSGFVIHYNYHYSIVTAPARGTFNFIVARFARLYPLYIFVIMLDLFRYFYFENLNNPTILEQIYGITEKYHADSDMVLPDYWGPLSDLQLSGDDPDGMVGQHRMVLLP
jgi:peptidoglycan/LPS O-acetylase OafA/YrhL